MTKLKVLGILWSAATLAATTNAAPVTVVHKGTPVNIVLSRTISANSIANGAEIVARLSEPLMDPAGSYQILPAGSEVRGRIGIRKGPWYNPLAAQLTLDLRTTVQGQALEFDQVRVRPRINFSLTDLIGMRWIDAVVRILRQGDLAFGPVITAKTKNDLSFEVASPDPLVGQKVTITLIDGAQYAGDLISHDNSQYRLRTTFGEITVPEANVRTIVAASSDPLVGHSVVIVLADGQQFTGDLMSHDNGLYRLRTGFGEISIPEANVREARAA